MRSSRTITSIVCGMATFLSGCGTELQPGAASVDELRDIIYNAHRNHDMAMMRSVLLWRVDPRGRPLPQEEEWIERLLAACVSIDEVEAINVGRMAAYIHSSGRQDLAPADYDIYKFILVGSWQFGDRVERRRVDPSFLAARYPDGTRAIFVQPLILKEAVESLEKGREPRYRAED